MLATSDLPWLGSSFDYRATGMPANSVAIEVRGLGTASVPLATLLPQGQAGCDLLVAVGATVLQVPQAGEVHAA